MTPLPKTLYWIKDLDAGVVGILLIRVVLSPVVGVEKKNGKQAWRLNSYFFPVGC
jgi:hypothetical protein